MDDPLVLTIVGPVAMTLIGLLVVWLQDWRRGRDAYSQRANARGSHRSRLVLREVADERDHRRYLAALKEQVSRTARAQMAREGRVGSPVPHV